MFYNQDDEENFLSDKKIGEKEIEETPTRRRGGAYPQGEANFDEPKRTPKKQDDDEEEGSIVNTVVSIIAIVVIIAAVIVMIMVFRNDTKSNNSINDKQENVTNNSSNTSTDNKKEENNKKPSNNNSSTTNNNSLGISSINENYNAYPIEIESVVFKKGGNFYNNNIGIKGDKVYVEYKQISGLKDEQKQAKINEMLESLSTELYDKNYLSDENTLFVDIHTKLSVNFNTLSYVVIRTGQDIDGKAMAEKVVTLNIRLDNLEKITFEDLFTDNASINKIYSDYVKGKVDNFYFDPKNIYVYKGIEETAIDMSKNYSDIAIYNRYKSASDLYTKSSVSKKVFTILDSTVSEETKDRAFVKSK